MHVLANAEVTFVGGEQVKDGHVMLVVRKRLSDQILDEEMEKKVPKPPADPKFEHFRKMEEGGKWVAVGCFQLIDTRSGIATRLHYHGPSCDELGLIRLVARLAFKQYGRDVVVSVKEGCPPVPMELEVYQLDPENQRIWLMTENPTDAKLVWPEPGKDTFPKQCLLCENVKEGAGPTKEG